VKVDMAARITPSCLPETYHPAASRDRIGSSRARGTVAGGLGRVH